MSSLPPRAGYDKRAALRRDPGRANPSRIAHHEPGGPAAGCSPGSRCPARLYGWRILPAAARSERETSRDDVPRLADRLERRMSWSQLALAALSIIGLIIGLSGLAEAVGLTSEDVIVSFGTARARDLRVERLGPRLGARARGSRARPAPLPAHPHRRHPAHRAGGGGRPAAVVLRRRARRLGRRREQLAAAPARRSPASPPRSATSISRGRRWAVEHSTPRAHTTTPSCAACRCARARDRREP